MSDPSATATVSRGRINKIVLGAAIGLAAVAVIGVILVVRFVESQEERDMQAWQVRLGIVADTRAAAVDEWLSLQFGTLQELAENASLQLYVTELLLAEEEDALDDEEFGEPAELSYLRNLLMATAQRAGFTAPEAEMEIAANVERAGLAGIALTDVQGNVIVSTPSMPPPNAAIRQAMVTASEGDRGLVDMYLGLSQAPTMGFVVPVYAIQADEEGSTPVGLVVGLRLVDDSLYGRLQQPGETATSAETVLIRVKDETTVEYLSPLADATAPLRRTLDLTTPELADTFVIETPGGFEIRRNYAGEDVLVTGRRISLAPWYLVRSVQTAEALTEIQGRSRTMLVVFILIIVGISVALVAVWRHGTSLRAAEAAERHRIAAEQFRNVTGFLRVVTDALPNPVMAVDVDGNIMFTNMAAAKNADMHPRDLIGKALSAVLGPVKAKILQRISDRAVDEQERMSEVHEFEEPEGERIVRSDHLPIPATTTRPAGALVQLEDITELTEERNRRERILRQLVQTLVAVVDQRDPYSANHSSRVAEVSRAVASEMGLSQLDQDTVEIAGNLINLGKILVPVELLTKTDNLTDEEREILRNSVNVSADLLEGVEFDGPVVNIIRQMQERFDGSGPQGLSGEQIEVGARIVATANAFVGMVSARAYRSPMSFDDAANALSDEAGTTFDRRPVAALVNYIDNRDGREQWANFSNPPEADGEAE